MKYPHDWIASTLGHGDAMCRFCRVTNREAAVIGIAGKECDARRAWAEDPQAKTAEPAPRPVRLKNSRKRGARLAIASQEANGLPVRIVARPSIFGNPWSPAAARKLGVKGDDRELAALCVSYFRASLDAKGAATASAAEALPQLVGFNLACYCALCERHAAKGKPFDENCADCMPCHADELGRRALALKCEGIE